MNTQAKLWIGVVSLLVVAVISYSVVMALGSPAPVSDGTVGAGSVTRPVAVSDSVGEPELVEQEPPAYVTGYNSNGVEDQGSVAIDYSPIPGTDVVTITINGATLVVDIEWSETKGGILTYDRITFNDVSGELLTLTGPYELAADGFVAVDWKMTRENPGQLFFTTVEGRYYRYDPKSEPRLILIKTN